MIKEDALWFPRGTLVEFDLSLGGGKRKCTGLVLNTAVLMGRGARQLWIVDMQGGTEEQREHWLNRKHIVHEIDIHCSLSTSLIGADALLRDNPVSYPVSDGKETEFPAVTITISMPAPTEIKP